MRVITSRLLAERRAALGLGNCSIPLCAADPICLILRGPACDRLSKQDSPQRHRGTEAQRIGERKPPPVASVLKSISSDFISTNLRNHCGVRRISGNPRGRGASRDCGAAAQKRIQRRCSKAMHAEHADASVRLQDRRPRIRYRRTAGIGSQAEPRPNPHPRVLVRPRRARSPSG